MGDIISVPEGTDQYRCPVEPAKSDEKYVKHVICEGAHFHVLSWSTKGTHCSEKNCIVNKENRL